MLFTIFYPQPVYLNRRNCTGEKSERKTRKKTKKDD